MEHKIREEMRVLPSIDPQFEIERRVAFIKRKLTEARCKSSYWASVVASIPQPVVAWLNLRLKNSTSNTIRRSTNLSRCVYLTASKR